MLLPWPSRWTLLALSLLCSLALTQPAAAIEVIDRAAFTGGVRDGLFSWRHLLVGIAIGLWASQLGQRAVWQIPLAYIAGFLTACFVSLAGIDVPVVGWAISAVLIALGLLMATQMAVPALLAVMIALIAGVAQGLADYARIYADHVLSGGAQEQLLATLFGIASAMFMLVVGGIGAAVMLRSATTEAGMRAVGVATAIAGLLMLDIISIDI